MSPTGTPLNILKRQIQSNSNSVLHQPPDRRTQPTTYTTNLSHNIPQTDQSTKTYNKITIYKQKQHTGPNPYNPYTHIIATNMTDSQIINYNKHIRLTSQDTQHHTTQQQHNTENSNTTKNNNPHTNTNTYPTTSPQQAYKKQNNTNNNPKSFCGGAGQPRPLACGDQKRATPTVPRKRNTKRGLRNINTIEKRKNKRTFRRRTARQTKRTSRHRYQIEDKGTGGKNKKTQNAKPATAQEPFKRKTKLLLGRKTRYAILNIRGIKKLGVRDEIELWMKKKNRYIRTNRNKSKPKQQRNKKTIYMVF